MCHQVGARSLSDLVRRSLLDANGLSGVGNDAVEDLTQRIDRLARLIEHLCRKFEDSLEVNPR
jgi:hypothetical protein